MNTVAFARTLLLCVPLLLLAGEADARGAFIPKPSFLDQFNAANEGRITVRIPPLPYRVPTYSSGITVYNGSSSSIGSSSAGVVISSGLPDQSDVSLPEPGTFLLLISALGALAVARRA